MGVCASKSSGQQTKYAVESEPGSSPKAIEGDERKASASEQQLPSKVGEEQKAQRAPIPHELLGRGQDTEQGLPYTVGELGPPLPPCEEQRLATVRALHVPLDVEAPPDPELESILRLVTSIFQCPAALVALFDDKRIFIRDSIGGFKRGDFPWRWSFCGWTMASQQDQIMVIPDATRDARFCQNQMVTGENGVRFYCGAPLIASNGHRLGTLCFADMKPREFDAGQATILGNLAEMVVRHIEKDIALQLRTHDNEALMAAYSQLKRAVDCFDHCVALLDLSAPGWKIMYVNGAWGKVTGSERELANGNVLGEVFEVVPPAAGSRTPTSNTTSSLLSGAGASRGSAAVLPSPAHLAAIAAGQEVVIENVVVRAAFMGSVTGSTCGAGRNSAGANSGGSALKRLVLRLRPAGKAALDDDAIAVAVPSYIKSAKPGDPSSAYYFMTIQPMETGTKRSSVSDRLNPASEAGWDEQIDPGLKMGVMLGKGAFGAVYRGTWYGTPVAVKIVDQDVKALGGLSSSLEALLGAELRHPNIVGTLKHITRRPNNTSSQLLADAPLRAFTDDTALASDGARTPVTAGSNVRATGASPAQPSTPKTTSPINTQGLASTAAPPPHAAPPACNATAASDQSNQRWAVINFTSRTSCVLEEEEGEAGQQGAKGRGEAGATGQPSAAMMSGTHGSGPVGAFNTYNTERASDAMHAVFEMTPMGGSDKHAPEPAAFIQTWIIMDFCDRGCLQDAVDRGWLRTPGKPASAANMSAIIATAYEVASALHYLHSHGIIHGDLSAWNVLLTSTGSGVQRAGRGFSAKIADFGLARSLDIRTRIQTKTYGTITHQPPETLSEGVVSRETDTYSLGVLMWQMYTGSRPWAGLTHSQIIMKVVQGEVRLQFPEDTPPAYARLAHACLSYDIAARPQMAAVVKELADMLDELST